MNSKRDALKEQYQQGVQGKPNFGNQGGAQGGGQSQSGAPSTSQEQPVYHGGKLIGYTKDGKTLSRLP
jgi:hypothetical protein